MILYVHKELTDQLDLHTVASEFIARNERRWFCNNQDSWFLYLVGYILLHVYMYNS